MVLKLNWLWFLCIDRKNDEILFRDNDFMKHLSRNLFCVVLCCAANVLTWNVEFSTFLYKETQTLIHTIHTNRAKHCECVCLWKNSFICKFVWEPDNDESENERIKGSKWEVYNLLWTFQITIYQTVIDSIWLQFNGARLYLADKQRVK